ncbi:bis-aminopropyl spermidine synthase family protein [Saccharopolyspora mangrovi]|uniref:Bis-aminopropyl spermidine synthase family protein n=1 Tax=Saccharopolyspora mangrovi TaxID=3082379 RepID=A0ABU6A9G9_9PSEU|nr:bis-aminopropyl spermidine synthase family protein [Saccharopolyspora sp. S2-29]MEB3368199.1 bis-aminopropyl spermidine synthase family protein [Saccharopolyspora sp. S2-29]
MNNAQSSAPIEAIRELHAEYGLLGHHVRRVLAELAAGPRSLDELVRRTGVSRRTVERVLAAAGEDLDEQAGAHRIKDSSLPLYRQEMSLDELPAARTGDDLDVEALEVMGGFIASGPRPESALDHVTATPETALRRAMWLRDNYELAGNKVLCLGDHDLTSLALSLVVPSAEVRVVDLDERILRHIDDVAAERGFDIGTTHADLRFGLPPTLESWADAVFTDPPYTPEGVGLFSTRAAECLAPGHSRMFLAYGYSPRTPALGLKVQQELLRLGFVFEAILPQFNRYYGAQAIGSASDLYVCQPSAHTRKLALRQDQAIYTHGPQSVEASGDVPAALPEAAAERLGSPVAELRRAGWARPMRESGPVAFDLRADPGPWLVRMLLACNATKVAFVLGNNHPDITNERAQSELRELVAAKYELKLHRSTPDGKHAIVVAERSGAESATGFLLERVHGKLGNVWREALIAQSEDLTKRQAREEVAELAPHPRDLELRLIDLPRHRIADVVRAMR